MTNDERLKKRIWDMLAELHDDPRKGFQADELRDVLGSDGFVRFSVAEAREKCVDDAKLAAIGYTYWGQGDDVLLNYQMEWEHAVRESMAINSHMETALRHKAATPGVWEKKNPGGHSLASRWRAWEKLLPSHHERLRKLYDNLSEQQKLFLTAPVPNPTRCDQFPRPGVAICGLFYPERSWHQRAQIAALEQQLIDMGEDM